MANLKINDQALVSRFDSKVQATEADPEAVCAMVDALAVASVKDRIGARLTALGRGAEAQRAARKASKAPGPVSFPAIFAAGDEPTPIVKASTVKQ